MKSPLPIIAFITCSFSLFAQHSPINNFPFQPNQALSPKQLLFKQMANQRFYPSSKISPFSKQRNHISTDHLLRKPGRFDFSHQKTFNRAVDSMSTHYLPLFETDSDYFQNGTAPGYWNEELNISHQYYTTICLDSVAIFGTLKVFYQYDAYKNIKSVTGEYYENSQWVNSYREFYTYDLAGNQIQELDQNWDGSNWSNYRIILNTYDAMGNQTEITYEDWNGSAWVNLQNYLYSYDTSGNLIESDYQDWDGSMWVNVDRYLNTTDSMINEIENIQLYQTWNGSDWVNNTKYVYDYPYETCAGGSSYSLGWNGSTWDTASGIRFKLTFKGNQVVKEEFQIVVDSAWLNQVAANFSYDSHGNLISSGAADWDTTTQQYDANKYRDTLISYSYYNSFCDNNITSYFYQTYPKNRWVNNSYDSSYVDTIQSKLVTYFLTFPWNGHSYLLDSNLTTRKIDSLNNRGNITMDEFQEYDSIQNKFVPLYKNVSDTIYGPNNELDFNSSFYYEYNIYPDTITSVFGSNQRFSDYITCTEITGLRFPSSTVPFSLFPNPAGNTVYLKAIMDKPAAVRLMLSDMLGKNLLTIDFGILSGSIEKAIDISRFPSGIYLAKLVVNGQTQTLKVIKD